MSGPLSDVTVLELIEKGPGAHVTMVLADMGARVIKIEAPARGRESGSGGSASPDNVRLQAANIANRGKRSITVDLKTPEGQQVLHRLARTADVLVEGFRPGVTARLAADYPRLSALNERLIYCSLSGYGQDGPYRDLPGHDINYLSLAGILNLVGERGGRPIVPPNLIADFGGAALHAICGILLALYARHRTGRGQHVDIAYLDSALSLLGATRPIREFLSEGKVAERGAGALGGSFAYYRVYETADQRYLSIGCVEPWLWENLCRTLSRADLIDGGPRPEDFHGSESPRQAQCREELEALFRTRTRDAWFELLSPANVCVGKVYEVSEVFDDPHLQHRGMVPRVPHPQLGEVAQIGVPIKLSETPGKLGHFAPWKGQHAQEILLELGYPQEQIDQLRSQRVI
ncbi:MAG TPA: CaiB/BaiF CoA-transferase family protein [Steroidobacteraceae bacterium]|nr:CaiB/BaiF CoA-transferase family protein [Steroidobacteraceae bacterium]